jgi:alpha-L-arabinofuranosidase
MLDDRKFYFPINSHPPAEPPGPSWRRVTLRHWMPVGADEFVTMDADHPYVGEHTPLVKLSSSEAHGIQQFELAVRKGKSYTGRIVLAGPQGTTVKVTLIWGSAANDRQVVTINKLGPVYRTVPLSFRAQGDSDDARLEIAGTGSGSFHIAAVSLMPANNMQGFSGGSHRRTQATALRGISLAGGQLRFGSRVARCNRRSRQASADHGPGLACRPAQRRWH